jgi:hypothetical protein
MRRRQNQVGFGKSFDSFLSIVTKNGLGMLILIAMASTLTNDQVLSETARFKEAKVERARQPEAIVRKEPQLRLSVGTPLVKKLPAGRKFAFFECLGERVFPSDVTEVEKPANEFFGGIDQGANVDELAEKLNKRRVANQWYTFEFKARGVSPFFPNEPAILFHPKSKEQGETWDELQTPDSLFRRKLQNIDKTRDVVNLRVWTDSFVFFRSLRDWLQSEGYTIRWDPVNAPEYSLDPLKFKGSLSIEVDS